MVVDRNRHPKGVFDKSNPAYRFRRELAISGSSPLRLIQEALTFVKSNRLDTDTGQALAAGTKD